jgi:hypothetical protein
VNAFLVRYFEIVTPQRTNASGPSARRPGTLTGSKSLPAGTDTDIAHDPTEVSAVPEGQNEDGSCDALFGHKVL